MSPGDAAKIAGTNPEYHTTDLFQAIERGEYPVWNLYLQVIEPKLAETYPVDIFDITKILSHQDFPLTPVGKLTLNKNVSGPGCICLLQIRLTRCFSRTTSSRTLNRLPSPHPTWSPQSLSTPVTSTPHLFGGVAALTISAVLQARMFAYPDAQRYRLGVNYQQLPTNRAVSRVYTPYERDGAASYTGNYGGDPNYVRSVFTMATRGPKGAEHGEWAGGKVGVHEIPVSDADFVQATTLWNLFASQPGEQEAFVKNVAGDIMDIPESLQDGVIRKLPLPGSLQWALYRPKNAGMFAKVDTALGGRLRLELQSNAW